MYSPVTQKTSGTAHLGAFQQFPQQGPSDENTLEMEETLSNHLQGYKTR